MPAGITIIGLGTGRSHNWTLAAYHILNNADEIYLRTTHHPSIIDIEAVTHSFDDFTSQHDNHLQTNQAIAEEIVRLGQRQQGVIYAVPGHPTFDEPTTPLIRSLAETHNIPVTIIPGLSLLQATITALKIDAPGNLQLVQTAELIGLHHPPLETDRPAMITHLSQNIVANVQKTLSNAYPDNFQITIVQNAGAESEHTWECELSRLNAQPYSDNAFTSLYLPAAPLQSGFSTFQETIAHLRAPDGCPWDREQTHQTLRPYLLEEAYEVLEALDTNDPVALAEELGDLLLQIVLHTQIAIDSGEFKMGAVIDHINRKLIRRHPHVFGDLNVSSASEVTTNWEAIKKAEKAAKGQSDEKASALDGVPDALPALAQAMTISKRAVRVGFEWPNIEGVLDKIIEEAKEITEANDEKHLESEIGDLLFSAVNLARWRGIDAETALRTTNARFSRRFKKMEALAAEQSRSLANMSIEEMDALWEQAKQQE